MFGYCPIAATPLGGLMMTLQRPLVGSTIGIATLTVVKRQDTLIKTDANHTTRLQTTSKSVILRTRK